MYYYNSLDIDTGNKDFLYSLFCRIIKNECCHSWEFTDSDSKGYHIKLVCKKKCDDCRLVFDDERRYAIDLQRPEKFRNVLFTEKEYFKPQNKRRVNTNLKCERCEKNKKITELIEKELSFDETLEKLKEGKIKIPLTPFGKKRTLQALYMGYTYFECPVCHWFKFVKGEIKNERLDKIV